MLLRWLFLLLAASFGLAGCSLFDQGGHTTVEGTVVDAATRQPVGPADVRLFTRSRTGSSAALSATGDWRPTNADGTFSFSFEADNDLEYVLRASSRRGDSDYITAPTLKGGHKNKNVQVPVNAPAWVRIHLSDVPPRIDAINIYVWGFRESLTIHPPQDTVIYRIVAPSIQQVVVWQLNGSRTVAPTEHRIPYIVVGMDTARIDIRY